jgi:hypothetical protein
MSQTITKPTNRMEAAELVPTPECDRMLAVKKESNSIGQFLDWLETNNYVIGEYEGGQLFSINKSFEKLLAEYFKIDLKKVDKEKRAILQALHDWDKEHPDG